jgi:hypothetical protein
MKMKHFQKGSASAVTIILIALILIGGGIYIYSKKGAQLVQEAAQTPQGSETDRSPSVVAQTPTLTDSVPAYDFSSHSSVAVPPKLTKITLSHQSIELQSPWGTEASYKGSSAGTLGQYVFANGIKLTVTLNKQSPQDELKEGGATSTLQFIISKLGANFTSYDYEHFLHETTQQTIDTATTQEDKAGYSEVLELKNATSLSGTVFSFTNSNGKGFAWVPADSDVPNAVDFWGPNGWRYTFLIPPKQNVNRAEIDAIMKSIRTL